MTSAEPMGTVPGILPKLGVFPERTKREVKDSRKSQDGLAGAPRKSKVDILRYSFRHP